VKRLGLAAVAIAALVAATIILRQRGPDEDAPVPSERAERLRKFWSAYQEGSEARTAGDYERAAEIFRSALAIDPRHEDSLFYLAVSLEETGRYSEAAEVLRRLNTVNPESARAWSQLGSLLARRVPGNQVDPERAAAAFRRAEEINKEHSGPFLSHGALALDLGDLAEARRQFEIASSMSSPEGAFLAGLVAFIERKDEEAIAFFTRVLEASAREKAITGRGVTSEGDVELSAKMTPLESAHLRAQMFLYWTARRRGGYPESVPESIRLELPGRKALGRVEKSAPSASGADCAAPDSPRFEGELVSVACADIDADGEVDRYLLFWKRPGRLLRSQGGEFADWTEKAGLGGVGGEGFSAVFFDFDGDRDSDLLVTAHAPLAYSLRRLLVPEGRASTLTPRLFENDYGRFREVTAKAGLDRQFGIMDAEAFDVDSDGLLDLVLALGGFEASHLEPSVVLRNLGGREFVEWAHIPSSNEPRNAGSVDVRKRQGGVEIVLRTRDGAS
jgi:tetratricopeptide (TPR) repeat protein